MDSSGGDLKRRPIAARDAPWARSLAARLARARVRPNAISFASSVFAAIAGVALFYADRLGSAGHVALLLVAAVCMPLRLICNLLDGMVAVEGGLKSKTGELWNELPDRLSDVFVLVPAGYAITASWGPELGWTCGTLALLVAYVRTLGSSAGARPDFGGPMAKQNRMVVTAAGCVVAAIEVLAGWTPRALAVALVVVAIGSLVTLVRRTGRIARDLDSR